MHHSFVEPFDLLHFSRVIRIEHEADVKIAVPGMPLGDHERRGVSGLGIADTVSPFGNPRICWTLCSLTGGRIAARRLIRTKC
jgi:hypothetical protein